MVLRSPSNFSSINILISIQNFRQMNAYLTEFRKAVADPSTFSTDSVIAILGRMLEDEAIHHFGQLLELPEFKELMAKDESLHPYQALVEIFAFGTFNDYRSQRGQLPALTDAQVKKLKQLTLVSMASCTKVLSYDALAEELDLKDLHQMEELVVDANYKDLVVAKLDQKQRRVEVDYVAGRDVRREDLTNLHRMLQQWSTLCQTSMETLSQQIKAANAQIINKRNAAQEYTKASQAIINGANKHRKPAAAIASRIASEEPVGLARIDSQFSTNEYQREEKRAA